MMVILNKKRILFILFVTIIGICIPTIKQDITKSVPTATLPVSNKVIVLDAGHGYPDNRGTKC